MGRLVEAVCAQDCYDSTTGQLFEKNKSYLVDPDNPWVKRHFTLKQSPREEIVDDGTTGQSDNIRPKKR